DDLVVNIREVLDVIDRVAAELQVAAHDVDMDVQPGVADMRMILGRESADIHCHGLAGRLEGLLAAREGVEELDHARPSRAAILASSCSMRLNSRSTSCASGSGMSIQSRSLGLLFVL